jgi:hypothetical protein
MQQSYVRYCLHLTIIKKMVPDEIYAFPESRNPNTREWQLLPEELFLVAHIWVSVDKEKKGKIELDEKRKTSEKEQCMFFMCPSEICFGIVHVLAK